MGMNTLQRIYQVFTPEPLSTKDSDLYVDLGAVRGDDQLVSTLTNTILFSNVPTCQIVTGHDGSGKTTELRRLQHILETTHQYFVLFCQIDRDIDCNDVDFPDVLIGILKYLITHLRKRTDITLQLFGFRRLFERLQPLPGLAEHIENMSHVSSSTCLETALGSLSSMIQSSPAVRNKLRECLEPDTSNWLRVTNDIISKAQTDLQSLGYKGMVIIVDGLDKMVLKKRPGSEDSTGEYLFVHRDRQLRAFMCDMVYTMPLPLAYSIAEASIAYAYGTHPTVISMAKINNRPPERYQYEPGRQALHKVIAQRLHRIGITRNQLFVNAKVCEDIITLSGGQPRSIMHFIRQAVTHDKLPISEAAIEYIIREGRRDYERRLRTEHWSIITEVRRTGSMKWSKVNEQQILDLLSSRAILQYRDELEWYDINPLINDLNAPEANTQAIHYVNRSL